MKKYILILAAALMACAGAFAQTNGNASASKKINKKNLIVKEWKSDGKSGASLIDQITIYSPEGKKIEETEFDNAGKQKWRKRYEWSESGKMTRELLYDERNRLVNYKKFEYNEFGKKKMQYTYDPKGKLISTKSYEYITQDV